jgi:hypothetical protein
MAYALVPDGFSIKKVTKAQKEAVSQYYNAESTKAFFEGPASGDLVKAVAVVVTPIVLTALAKQGFEITAELTESLTSKILETVGGVIPEIDWSKINQIRRGA